MSLAPCPLFVYDQEPMDCLDVLEDNVCYYMFVK